MPLLEAALSEGKYSPQKVLMKAKIKIIQAPDPNTLLNVNTPAEKEKVMALLK